MKGATVFVLLLCLTWDLAAIDLTDVDFSHKYNPDAPVRLNHRLLKEGDASRLMLAVKFYSSDVDQLDIGVFLQQSFTDSVEVALDGEIINKITGVDNWFHYQYSFATDTTYKLVVVKITNLVNDTDYYFDVLVDPDLDFSPPDFQPYVKDSVLLFNTFLDNREQISFSQPGITAYQYGQEFPAAMPPMSKIQEGSKNLGIDTVIAVGDKFDIQRGKFYFFQSDTSSLSGIGILGVTPLYPKLISLDELLKPLVYISTSKEFDLIMGAGNRKSAMDKFWLDVTGQKERALSVIKRYYQRVREANDMFTSYKEGWKTDMGMIYILFGTPTTVSKTKLREEWTYRNQNGSEDLIFTFNKVKNIFTKNHYTLNRSDSYGNSWFRQVDLWRKGRI